MRGIFVSCPACRRVLMKNAVLRTGTYFDIKCFHCGEPIHVDTRSRKLETSYKKPDENSDDPGSDVYII